MIIVEFVKYLLPKTASVENVTGLLSSKHRKHLQKLVRMLIEIGYSVLVFTIDASHYGDPQERERVVVFASRIDHSLPEVPTATHGHGPELKPLVTVKDAIGDLEDVEPAEGCQRVLAADGKTPLMNMWRETKARPTDEKDTMKLKADRPAKTVLRRNYIEHYSKPRPLAVQERARLMGLPDSFQLFGSVPQACDMIGNGVPVNLSTAIGTAIRESYCYTPIKNKMTAFAQRIWEDMDLP